MNVVKILLAVGLVAFLVYQVVSVVKAFKDKRARRNASEEDKNIDKEDKG